MADPLQLPDLPRACGLVRAPRTPSELESLFASDFLVGVEYLKTGTELSTAFPEGPEVDPKLSGLYDCTSLDDARLERLVATATPELRARMLADAREGSTLFIITFKRPFKLPRDPPNARLSFIAMLDLEHATRRLCGRGFLVPGFPLRLVDACARKARTSALHTFQCTMYTSISQQRALYVEARLEGEAVLVERLIVRTELGLLFDATHSKHFG